MKTVNIPLEDDEYDVLMRIKHTHSLTWKELLMSEKKHLEEVTNNEENERQP